VGNPGSPIDPRTFGRRGAGRGFGSAPQRTGRGAYTGAAALTAGAEDRSVGGMIKDGESFTQFCLLRTGSAYSFLFRPGLGEELLFDARLDPGGDVVAQLVQGPVLRRGQAAAVLRRLGTGEGLEPAAPGAARRGVPRDVLLWRSRKKETGRSLEDCLPMMSSGGHRKEMATALGLRLKKPALAMVPVQQLT